MSPTSRSRLRRRRRSLLNPWTVAAGVAGMAIAVAITFAVSNDPSLTGERAASVAATGEMNDMGMPVIQTPGTASGTVVAGWIEVDGANWSLGTVPLNTAVRPSWVLRNSGAEPVTVAEPHPEVREGCCPGPFSIGSRTIPPGGETTLTFELSMHPGMDGWHDIAVHVPVATGVAQDGLTLGVTGDFRDR